MKKLCWMLLGLLVFTACGNTAEPYENDGDFEDYYFEEEHDEGETLLDIAIGLFESMGEIYDRILLFDPVTREAISNVPDPEGLFERIASGFYMGVLSQSTAIRRDGIVYFGTVAWEGLNVSVKFHPDGGAALTGVSHMSAPTQQIGIPLDVASLLFRQVEEIWDEDGGRLWGMPLHVPLLLIEPQTRQVVANMPDLEGFLERSGEVYVGILPQGVVISNTAVNFGGLFWGMTIWGGLNDDHVVWEGYSALDIFRHVMIHEGFHAIQPQIVSGPFLGDGVTRQPSFDYMNNAEARITAVLEINALFAALRADGEERIAAVGDALSLRAHRHSLFPEAAAAEFFMEINEGLATYTEILFFGGDVLRLVDIREGTLGRHQNTQTFNLLYAYLSGMAYALLLDEFGVDWQQNLTSETNLAGILQQALGLTGLTPFAELDGELYGYSEIAPAQRQWAAEFEEIAAPFVEALFNRPTIWLAGNSVQGVRGEANTFTLGGRVMFRGYWTFTTDIWHLDLNGGFLEREYEPGNQGLRLESHENIEISEDGRRAVSPTWVLEILDNEYKIVAAESSIEVVRR